MTRSLEDRATLRRAAEIRAEDRERRKASRPKLERKAVGHVNLKADRGRVRDNGYLAYLRRQPCVIGVALATSAQCGAPVEACHIRMHKPGEVPTGMQRKPDDSRATAMCHHHHMAQHSGSEGRFWASYGLDPFAVAEKLFAAYQAGDSRPPVGGRGE